MSRRTLFLFLGLLLLLGSANMCKRLQFLPSVTKTDFGTTPEGQRVTLYTLKTANQMQVSISDFGGAVVSIRVPDNKGQHADVVLGFDRLEDYLTNPPHFGTLIGRYANRIGQAGFTLDGVRYSLAANNGNNHLHGGLKGFDKVLWRSEILDTHQTPSIKLTYLSADGEEGYPGNLTATVIYSLTNYNELKIDYIAATDKPTIVNLTNHSYFNLAGVGSGDILGHLVRINADFFTPIDAELIPTGEMRPVEGTPVDFRTAKAIGARIDDADEQLKFGRGYDHNFVLNKAENAISLAARVIEPASGRVMEVYTTEPGLQFYTGNFLNGTVSGKGVVYTHRSGFCMETQHFPDSPNKTQFPSVVLRPGETYRSTTLYKFLTQ